MICAVVWVNKTMCFLFLLLKPHLNAQTALGTDCTA